METGSFAERNFISGTLQDKRRSCLFAYPFHKDGEIEAITIFNFEIPVLEGLEEELRRTNTFLYNLLQSACDGVIAADRTGKIIIFNDAAMEVTGYSVEEALDSLNIRAIYEGDAVLWR